MTWRALAIGGACATAACESFGSGDTPSDGGARSADVAAADAGPSDAGSFCALQSPALFLCDDFEASPSMATWTELAQANGGVIEGNNGKLTARGDTSVAGQAWAYLRKQLGSVTNEVIYSFTMQNMNPGADAVELGGIIVDEPPGIPYSCMLNTLPDGTLSIWEVGESPPGTKTTLQKISFSQSPPVNAKTRFRMHWTLVNPPKFRVYLDDAPTPVVEQALTPTRTIGQRHVLVGASHFTKPGVAFQFDDVTIDRR
jgi:hypothetical protein